MSDITQPVACPHKYMWGQVSSLASMEHAIVPLHSIQFWLISKKVSSDNWGRLGLKTQHQFTVARTNMYSGDPRAMILKQYMPVW